MTPVPSRNRLVKGGLALQMVKGHRNVGETGVCGSHEVADELCFVRRFVGGGKEHYGEEKE
jgi:hypothetical protein